MSIETTTKLATVTVGAGGIASVSFSNIPQTYTDLKLVVSARSTRNNATYPVDNLNIAFNGASAGVSVAQRSLYTYEATGSQIIASGNDTYLNNFMIKADGGTASTFSSGEVYVSNYTSSNVKPISMDSVAENNSTKAWLMFNAGVSLITAPITSIQMYALSGNLVEHSTFTLYGVKAMRTAVGSSIKATGGTISFDGTYVTHTFNSTGLFTPTQSLIADYLVVAGGGGGGRTGGGGGAGGFRTSIGGSSLFLTTTSYAVTVGAGGAGTNTDGATGSSGSDSVFSTITSSGGGGGGSIGINGAAGGSGGGGGTNDSGTPYYTGGAGNTPSTSPSQGNTGGIGGGGYPTRAGGGGGGAGAVGGAAAGASSGNGGNGSASSITGTSVTYAGGGGSLGATGGTGGGGTESVNVGNATVNTGGGGAARNASTGGTGGSGIVVIRYKA